MPSLIDDSIAVAPLLVEIDGSDRGGIWAQEPDGTVRHVVIEGERLQGTNLRLIDLIGLANPSGGSDGSPGWISADSGQIAFLGRTDDGIGILVSEAAP